MPANMRSLALLGGMSYHATAIYYTRINEGVQRSLGGSHSANLWIHSFNHAEMQDLFLAQNWGEVSTRLISAARHLKTAGAEGVIICCNTAHIAIHEVEDFEAATGMRFIHIVDPIGCELQRRKCEKVALLGTKAVMAGGVFTSRLKGRYGIECVVPTERQCERINEMIMRDLARGVVTVEARQLVKEVVVEMEGKGAKGIVLACTELQMVVKKEDVDLPVFDTMETHIREACRWVVEG